MLRTRPFPLVPFGISALLVCGGCRALRPRPGADRATRETGRGPRR
jgi:hypothetical protein